MVPGSNEIYRMDTFPASNIETFAIFDLKIKKGNKVHAFTIQEIDLQSNKIFLETLDPKKNYTSEQLKENGLKHKVVFIDANALNQVKLMISGLYEGKVSTSKLEVCIRVGRTIKSLSNINVLQYLDREEYGVLLKNYVQFGRLAAAHAKKNQAIAVK